MTSKPCRSEQKKHAAMIQEDSASLNFILVLKEHGSTSTQGAGLSYGKSGLLGTIFLAPLYREAVAKNVTAFVVIGLTRRGS